MNADYIYAIFYTCERENLPDLTIGMAYYREQHPEITQAEDDAMIGFISRHIKALAKAYPDKVAFFRAWAEGIAEDLKRAQEQEAEENKEEAEG